MPRVQDGKAEEFQNELGRYDSSTAYLKDDWDWTLLHASAKYGQLDIAR